MGNEYDWNRIEAERRGGSTIKALADKYGNSKTAYSYFRRKLKDVKPDPKIERTVEELITHKLRRKADKKVAKELADTELDLRIEYNKINKYIRYSMAGELKKGKNTDFNRLKQLKISSQILRNCREMDWEIHEIQDVAKKIEMNGSVNVKGGYTVERYDELTVDELEDEIKNIEDAIEVVDYEEDDKGGEEGAKG